MRVLIADDAPMARLVLRVTLEQLGHEVIVTESGTEAWARFQADTVDAVISDWMMPDLDGLELCRRIRAAAGARYTYVILVTALSGKTNYLHAMDAGVDDFLSKPFDPDELAARLRVGARIVALHTRVGALERLLPMCSYCKRIRDQDQTWLAFDRYVMLRTDTALSHGICPECYEAWVKPQLG